MRNLFILLFLGMGTILNLGCKNSTTAYETSETEEHVGCDSQDYEIEDVNATQENGYLFDCGAIGLSRLVDSIAGACFEDSSQYRIRYNFLIDLDSNGGVVSIDYGNHCGQFCSKIDSLVRHLGPPNLPYYLPEFKHLWVYDNSVNLSIRFTSRNSHPILYYSKAILKSDG